MKETNAMRMTNVINDLECLDGDKRSLAVWKERPVSDWFVWEIKCVKMVVHSGNVFRESNVKLCENNNWINDMGINCSS